MLAIRMQRTGRTGYATFRIIVQDSRFSPKSGRVVAQIGHYNPHTKEKSINAALVTKYLGEGAQPTTRVVRLLLAEKMKLPEWVKAPDNSKKTAVKHAEKLRKNRPEEPTAPTEDEGVKNEDVAAETEIPNDEGGTTKEESAEETTPEVSMEQEPQSDTNSEEVDKEAEEKVVEPVTESEDQPAAEPEVKDEAPAEIEITEEQK